MSVDEKFTFCSWTTLIVLVLLIKCSGAARYNIVVKTGTQYRVGRSDGPGTDAYVTVILYGISTQTNQEDHTNKLDLSGSLFHNFFESGQTDTFNGVKDSKDLTNLTKIKIKRSNFGLGPDWLLDKLNVTTQDGKTYEFNANLWLTQPNKYYEVGVSGGTSPSLRPNNPSIINLAPASNLMPASRTIANPAPALSPSPANPMIANTAITPTLTPTNPLTINLAPTLPARSTNPTIAGTAIPPIPTPTNPLAANPVATMPPIIATPAITNMPATSYPVQANPTTPSRITIAYDIIVYTGSSSQASSNANVYVTLYGALANSSEIHLKSPVGSRVFAPASSKVFRLQLADLGRLERIRIRQDGLGVSPNWKIDKIMVIVQNDRVQEFVINGWLEPGNPLEKRITDVYPALSIKFTIYTSCLHPLGSKVHPDPNTLIVLANTCAQLPTFFRLFPDGVIRHLTSGMCVQGESTGDPKNILNGSKLILNPQCSLYFPGVSSPHALQFKFTPGGSLQEVKSGKCVATNQGILQTPLTFSDVCDTDTNKIVFIDKSGQVILPGISGLSPSVAPAVSTTITPSPAVPAPASPSPIPGPPGQTTPTGLSPPGQPGGATPVGLSPPLPPGLSPPRTTGTPNPSGNITLQTGNKSSESGLSLVDPRNPEYGGNNSHVLGGPLLNFCPGGCSSACQPSCTQACCGVPPPGFPPWPVFNQYQFPVCPEFCTPANCRSSCHINCCNQRDKFNVWKKLMTRNNQIKKPKGGDSWD